jgi:hypothetical protein
MFYLLWYQTNTWEEIKPLISNHASTLTQVVMMWPVLRRCPVWISTVAHTILTRGFLWFPSVTPGEWFGQYLEINHDHFLLNRFKFTNITVQKIQLYTCSNIFTDRRWPTIWSKLEELPMPLTEDRFFWYWDFSTSLTTKISFLRQDENYDRLW